MKSFVVRSVAMLCLVTSLARSADTVELLPGKIAGGVSLSGADTVTSGYISLYATDGSGASASASFNTSNFSVTVPGGKTWRGSLSLNVSADGGGSSNLYVTLPDEVTVGANQTVAHTYNVATAHLDANVTVQHGALSNYTTLQASGNDGSVSFSASVSNQGFLVVVPMNNISVYGTVAVTNAANQSGTLALSPQLLSSVGPEGGSVSWTVDAAFSAGSLTGKFDFQGPATPSSTYTYVYDPNYTFLGYQSGSPFEFDNLATGTIHVYGYAYFPDQYLQFTRDVGITAGDVTNISFGGNEAFVTTPVQLTGFMNATSLSGAQLTGYTSTPGESTYVGTQYNASTGSFVSTVVPGDWYFYSSYFTVADATIPGNYYYTQIGVNDYVSTPVTVAGGSSVTRPAMSLDTTEAEFTFDVIEPAGSASETLIQNPTINGSTNRFGSNGQYLGSYSVYAANYGNAQAKPRVRVIAPPGTYDFTAYGTVDGSQTSFGHFTITLQQPLQTPIGSSVAINPGSGVSLVFGQVTSGGVTTAAQLPVGPALPAGYTDLTNNGDKVYYSVSTSAGFDGGAGVTVTLSYNDSSVPEDQQSNLHLFYYQQSTQSWIDITGSVDTQNNTITGTSAGVGLYAVASKDKSKDSTAPVITAADVTVEATGPNGAVAAFAPTATDDTDGTVPVTTSIASGSTFPVGTTSVTATATDAAGNVATVTFKVIVQDTLAPTIQAPANIVTEATSAQGAAVTFAASATDSVDGSVAVTSAVASGSVFPIGTTPVTLSATDAHGNTSHAVFSVTVQDTKAPIIAKQDNLVVEATGPNGATVTFTPSASDLVSGAVKVDALPKSGSVFPIGTSTVDLVATDAAGNTARSSFTVTVQDTTAPVISAPSNLVAEATSASGAAVSYSVSATDLVDGTVSVSASHASGTVFPIGTTTVAFSAVDAHGNTASSSFAVTVKDTTAPKLTVPANLTLEATSAAGAVANFAASATDIVTASPTITYSVAPGSTFAIGTTTVNVNATDAAGNKSTGSFTVTVRDTTAPTFTSLTASPNSIWPPNKKMVAVTITPNIADNVGATSVKIVSVTTNEPDGTTQWSITGDLTLTLKADRLGTGTGRVYTITVEARDAAGNATRKTVTVTVPHDQGN